jgi:ComEC/Rec2-related protein
VFLLYLALAWLFGSILPALGLPWLLAPAAALLALSGTASVRWWVRACFAVLLAFTALAASHLYLQRQSTVAANDIGRFTLSGPVRILGVVEGDRDERQRVLLLRLRVSGVDDGTGVYPASGLLLVRLPLTASYEDGDRLELRGNVVTLNNEAGSDYRSNLAKQGVSAELDYPIARRLGGSTGFSLQHDIFLLRSRMDQAIRSVLPEPEATLGAGLAVGTRRVTDPALNSALSDTDAAMIVVATGYNVTILGILTVAGLAWLIGRRQAAVAAMFVMAGYALLLGPYPSILRAAIMGAIVMAAIVVGRPHAATRALIIACAVMVAIDSSALTSISFPLTATATGGVVLLLPALRNLLRAVSPRVGRAAAGRDWAGGVADSAALTLAAIIPALPVVVAATHRLSLVSLPVNLILFPLIPWMTAFSLATAFAGTIWHPLALVFAPAAFVLLRFLVVVVRLGAATPAGIIEMDWFNQWVAIGIYLTAGVTDWIVHSGKRLRWPERLGHDRAISQGKGSRAVTSRSLPLGHRGWMIPSTLVLVALAAFAFAMAPRLTGALDDASHLHVTYLDVGQGSAILAQSGSGRILVNTGLDGSATVAALDRVLPPWQRSLNLVVLTDALPAHAGGLDSVLGRYHVGGVINTDVSSVSPDWQSRQLPSAAMKLPQAPVSTFELGGWEITVSSRRPATSSGNASAPRASQAAVVAKRGGRTVVLAGDTDALIPADVRTVAPSSTGYPAVQATVQVLETSRGTPRIPESGGNSQYYRTAENGDVSVDVGTSDLQIHVARGPMYGIGAVH